MTPPVAVSEQATIGQLIQDIRPAVEQWDQRHDVAVVGRLRGMLEAQTARLQDDHPHQRTARLLVSRLTTTEERLADPVAVTEAYSFLAALIAPRPEIAAGPRDDSITFAYANTGNVFWSMRPSQTSIDTATTILHEARQFYPEEVPALEAYFTEFDLPVPLAK
jgi:hypothetical protein